MGCSDDGDRSGEAHSQTGPALAAEVVNNCGAEAGQLFKSPETTGRRFTRSADQEFPKGSGRCHAVTFVYPASPDRIVPVYQSPCSCL